jgi:hypothetical protein
MDFEEDDDDDYGLYIEELKSENPNLKFNAAQKIVNVSKVLGNIFLLKHFTNLSRYQKNKRRIYPLSH